MATTLTDPNFQANFVSNTSLAPIVDQQNLTHVFTDELALKNCLDMETDVLPDAVVHMMQNRVFIPLSLLTTAALHHIQLNQMSSSGASPLEMALAVPRSMKLLSLLKIRFLSQILASYKIGWLLSSLCAALLLSTAGVLTMVRWSLIAISHFGSRPGVPTINCSECASC